MCLSESEREREREREGGWELTSVNARERGMCVKFVESEAVSFKVRERNGV